jgi:hypothetical protein
VGRDIGPISSQILAKIAHPFSLAHWIRAQREGHLNPYAWWCRQSPLSEVERTITPRLWDQGPTRYNVDDPENHAPASRTVRAILKYGGTKDIQHGVD